MAAAKINLVYIGCLTAQNQFEMENTIKESITVSAWVNAPIEHVWKVWTEPEHIMQWNNASEDWHTPHATIDLRAGGKFSSRMEAKDGSFGFDFEGVYDEVTPFTRIQYTMPDSRKVDIQFSSSDAGAEVIETFEIEDVNSAELQRQGWQAILDNFKRHAELTFIP